MHRPPCTCADIPMFEMTVSVKPSRRSIKWSGSEPHEEPKPCPRHEQTWDGRGAHAIKQEDQDNGTD